MQNKHQNSNSDQDLTSLLNDEEILSHNLQAILDNAEIILSTPEFFYCQPEMAHLGVCWIGGGPIPLGVLVKLWKDGKLILTCPHCNGSLYVFQAGGSPLSGRNSCRGCCIACNESYSVFTKQFGGLWHPIIELMKRHENKPEILKGKHPVFSWSKGLVGESVPDTIIKDSIHGVGLETLIRKLNYGGW